MQQQDPLTPYGKPQPAPVFAAPPVKQPGSTSTKVWGVLLIIFGLYGLMSLLGTIAIAMGTFSSASFVPAANEELREGLTQAATETTDLMLSRWTFWASTGSEVVIMALSLVAGFMLVLKPQPLGRSLAIARALVVLLFLPVYAYESILVIDDSIALQTEAMRESLGDSDELNSVMRISSYVGMVVMVVGIIAINALLLFFMTRPGVRDYLKAAAEGRDNPIPQFDPSMGIMYPPQQAPPQPDQQEPRT
jgi:hypothetical protein